MLFCSYQDLQTAGSRIKGFRLGRSTLHATWHKLRDILRSDEHYVTSGKIIDERSKTDVNKLQVALTSPDPELNFEADSYFTRHMRILETCSSAWPMPEIQKQVDSLREAFSADINQPFELRANFPYGTPKRASEGDTPTDTSFVQDVMSTANQVSRTAYAASMAPPVQKCLMSHNNTAHAMVMMNNTAPNELENMQMSQQASQWNPTRIFE